MPKIHKLSPHIVSQIAAGEVIERPSYAVKELIENAIDAGATQIDVRIEESGHKKIVVTDNGSGMSKEDLLQSYKPHTTSKLLKETDLNGISTLGFRGEALASIASISDVTIQSKRRKDISGYSIQIHNGKPIKSGTIGMPEGTSVVIKNLFANVPARKKFLKSDKTELRHIIDTVSNYALSYSNIEFSLRHNDRVYFVFTKTHSLKRRIQTLFGNSLLTNLLPITASHSYIHISGFISRPQFSTKGNSKLYTFVNGRRIYSSVLAGTIKDAYKNLLEYGTYPIALLFITVPPERIDVNIHPRKETINFLDPSHILDVVKNTIEETLRESNLTFRKTSWRDGGTKTYLAKTLKGELLKDEETEKEKRTLQIHNLYILHETKNGLYIIDQHAAHEAILFRKLKSLYEKSKDQPPFTLPNPLLLELSLSDTEILLEHIVFFNDLGFEIEEFNSSLRVNKVPSIFRDRNIVDLTGEFLEDIRAERIQKDIDTRTYRMLSYLACRTAIKGGTELTSKEQQQLLSDLQNEDMMYTCPHGRPVKIEFSLQYLHRLFRRQ